MKQLTSFFQKILGSHEVRKKVVFTAAVFFVFRFFAHIPVPAVDIVKLRPIFEQSQLLSFLNIFSGGTLSNFSVMAVGINPFITASIILQLASLVIPSLKELQKEGESGKEKYNQYTRMLSVPIAVVQSVSVLVLLRSQSLLITESPLMIVTMLATLVAGAMILMWLGELVSEYGIGNGISMVLFAGIVGRLPVALTQIISVSSSEDYVKIGVFGVLFLLMIALMVFMNEAVRKVNIQYAKRLRGDKMQGGQQTHFPIRVNVAGVMPIIFAVSLMLVPPFAGRFLATSSVPMLSRLGQQLLLWFSPTSVIYMVVYFMIVFIFTFFSAVLFFNADDISDELKKSGAFVPGIRPGGATKKFLQFVVTRITFVGAVFLGCIAVLPSIVQSLTNIQSLALGGTSMLIVVSVVLETAKQIDSLLVGQNYDSFV